MPLLLQLDQRIIYKDDVQYNLVHLRQLNVLWMRRLVSFILLAALVALMPGKAYAQWLVQKDTLAAHNCTTVCKGGDSHKFRPQQLIAPAALLAVGAIGSTIDDFKEIDFGLADRGHHKTPHSGFVAEDLVQYVPAAGFYALKLLGVKSVHNYRDASVILVASYGITAVATKVVKEIAGVQRPNGVDDKSFPSGHSAVAFMGAEFLRMEYKDVSPWIGVAGYAVATGTALARIGHNEHWLTDVIAGAGIGSLGTRVAYWIYPSVQRLLFGKIFKCKDMGNTAFMGLPYYDGTGAGVSLALRF